MKKYILYLVKYTDFVYRIYFCLGSLFMRLLRLFFHSEKNTIIFSSFGGRKYDDSPKSIYDAIVNDSRFDNCNLIWAFMEPDRFSISRGEKVKVDTFKYYKTLLKAGIWITNSSLTRGLYFRGTNTFCINPWHGTPIKYMGKDVANNNSFHIKKSIYVDIRLCQSQYDLDIFSRVFNSPKETFRIVGLPRNDELAISHSDEWIDQIKSRLGVSKNKKIILYAPTFREYDKDAKGFVVANPPIVFSKWKKELGNQYVILVRMHYEVMKAMKILDDGFTVDVSDYPNLNELILVSDMLISDYSSIFFDYSITGKPMLCFTYDYDKYNTHRGMYIDIREELGMKGRCETEDKIIEEIRTMDIQEKKLITTRFRSKYVEAYGSATRQTLDIIANHLCIK